MSSKDWVEVVWCSHCGYKIVRPWQPHPNGLYGNKIQCPAGLCRKEFVVTYAILKDRDASEGVLERETHNGFQPRQSTLTDFFK